VRDDDVAGPRKTRPEQHDHQDGTDDRTRELGGDEGRH
jgi:hypothetical protein